MLVKHFLKKTSLQKLGEHRPMKHLITLMYALKLVPRVPDQAGLSLLQLAREKKEIPWSKVTLQTC